MSSGFKVVIPARYQSVRFPAKSLADIHGKPMIQYVYEAALKSGADEVIVATDSKKIVEAVEVFGAPVCMTSDQHQSGTDRIAEVADTMKWTDDTIVVNLQGDEPLTPPDIIAQVANNLSANEQASCATLCTPITEANDVNDPNIVKVVFDNNGYALYFSRAAIPFDRDAQITAMPYYRHIGLYAYRASLLHSYSALPHSTLEHCEKLEQLRLLSNGLRIHVAEASSLPGAGVDTPEDLDRVKSMLV